jgi:hypothetical protein
MMGSGVRVVPCAGSRQLGETACNSQVLSFSQWTTQDSNGPTWPSRRQCHSTGDVVEPDGFWLLCLPFPVGCGVSAGSSRSSCSDGFRRCSSYSSGYCSWSRWRSRVQTRMARYSPSRTRRLAASGPGARRSRAQHTCPGRSRRHSRTAVAGLVRLPFASSGRARSGWSGGSTSSSHRPSAAVCAESAGRISASPTQPCRSALEHLVGQYMHGERNFDGS